MTYPELGQDRVRRPKLMDPTDLDGRGFGYFGCDEGSFESPKGQIFPSAENHQIDVASRQVKTGFKTPEHFHLTGDEIKA